MNPNKYVPRGRAILCVILCAVFVALTTYQFSYYAAWSGFRHQLAETEAALRAEREAAIAAKNAEIAALETTIAARDEAIAALNARADGLVARLVELTGSEEGTAEDCLRKLLYAALVRGENSAFTTPETEDRRAQIEAYIATYADDFWALSKQLLFIDYLYQVNYVADVDYALTAEAMIEAYAAAAGDVYAGYYTAEEYAAYLDTLNSSVTGIGVVGAPSNDESVIDVLHVHSASPSAAAGILAGDRILAVNGQTVAALGYTEACARIAGEVGTAVTLTVQTGSATPRTVTVTRAKSEADTVIYRTYEAGTATVGYIRILNFTAATGEHFADAVEAVRTAGAEALVLDVRDNTGGLLSSALAVLEYLLPTGTPLVAYDHGNENNQAGVYTATDAQAVDLPIYVLQNRRTASAAELLAAVLARQTDAALIGEITYGKGLMQRTFHLPDGDHLSISVAYFRPAEGASFDGVGVAPAHIAVPEGVWAEASIYRLPLTRDVALQKALALATPTP